MSYDTPNTTGLPDNIAELLRYIGFYTDKRTNEANIYYPDSAMILARVHKVDARNAYVQANVGDHEYPLTVPDENDWDGIENFITTVVEAVADIMKERTKWRIADRRDR